MNINEIPDRCNNYKDAKQIKFGDGSFQHNLPSIKARIIEIYDQPYKTKTTKNWLLFLKIGDETGEIVFSISIPNRDKLTEIEKGKFIIISNGYLKTNNTGTTMLMLLRGRFQTYD